MGSMYRDIETVQVNTSASTASRSARPPVHRAALLGRFDRNTVVAICQILEHPPGHLGTGTRCADRDLGNGKPQAQVAVRFGKRHIAVAPLKIDRLNVTWRFDFDP
jgi:hypothetical protein